MNRKSSRLSLRNNLTTHSDKKPGFTPTPIGKRKSAIAQLVWGFTLLELIIVIIIVGILAALGLTAYTSQIENARLAEAKANLGAVRKLVYEYYLKNGSLSGIEDSDVMARGSVPTACASNAYFWYRIVEDVQPYRAELVAERCTANGKSPNAANSYDFELCVIEPAQKTFFCTGDSKCPAYGKIPTCSGCSD